MGNIFRKNINKAHIQTCLETKHFKNLSNKEIKYLAKRIKRYPGCAKNIKNEYDRRAMKYYSDPSYYTPPIFYGTWELDFTKKNER